MTDFQSKQETIQKSNEKPAVLTHGQNYSKVTLHTKTFPTIPIIWRLIWSDKGVVTQWKIFIYGLIPGRRQNRAFKKLLLWGLTKPTLTIFSGFFQRLLFIWNKGMQLLGKSIQWEFTGVHHLNVLIVKNKRYKHFWTIVRNYA
jgi:hypothetical protein